MQQAQAIIAALLALLGFHGAQAPQSGQAQQGGQQQQQGVAQQTTLAPVAGICLLTPPANPLSAQGLATPWQLSGNAAGTPCTQENNNTTVFVEATILDPATGKLSAYQPLVIDQGTQPLAAPVAPTLPANAVVGIDIGANTTVDLPAGVKGCTDGVDSVFSQQAYCNMPAVYRAVNRGIAFGQVQVPPIGTAKDGKPCPTSRDFSITDQDQSDNTDTHYLVMGNQTAQDTAANRAKFANATLAANGSDLGLVVPAVDKALACTPWMVPNLGDPGQTVATGPLEEIQAARFQGQPVALVPAGDDFVLNPSPAGAMDLNKLNLYRQQVDQRPVGSLNQASDTTYCSNLLKTGLPRIAGDMALTQGQPSPLPAVGNNLFTFLAARFQATFQDQPGFLHCTTLLGVQNPVTTTMDGNGVVTAATINLNPAPLQTGAASGAQTNGGNGAQTPPSGPAQGAGPSGKPQQNPVSVHRRRM